MKKGKMAEKAPKMMMTMEKKSLKRQQPPLRGWRQHMPQIVRTKKIMKGKKAKKRPTTKMMNTKTIGSTQVSHPLRPPSHESSLT